jgi:predicted DNA-binding transcriptional regulator AlpA
MHFKAAWWLHHYHANSQKGDLRMPRTAKRVAPKPEPASPAQLLTTQQVMTWLNVSRTELWKMMYQKGLPHIKLGDGRNAALRFDAQSIGHWLTQYQLQTRE